MPGTGDGMSAYRAYHMNIDRRFSEHSSAVDHVRGIGVLGAVLSVLFSAASGAASSTHLRAVDIIAPLFLFSFGYVLDRSFRRRMSHGVGGAVLHFTKRHLALLLLGLIEMMLAHDRSWGLLISLGVAGILSFPFLFGGIRSRLGGAALLFAFYAFGPSFAYEVVSPLERLGGGTFFGALPYASFVLCAGAVSMAERESPGLMTAIRCIVVGSLSFAAGALLALAPGMGFSTAPISLSYLMASFGMVSIVAAVFMVTADHFRFSVPVIEPLGKNPLIACSLALVLGELIARIGNMRLSGASLYLSVTITVAAVLIAVFMLKRRRMFIRI